MMDVFKIRLKTVLNLSNCPVCGSGVLRAMAPGSYARAYFDCGAVFSTTGGEEIRGEIGCPQPTVVAARSLNAEVSGALRPAATPAVTLDEHEIRALEMLAGERDTMPGAWVNACLERLAGLQLCTNLPYGMLPAGYVALREAKEVV